MLSIVKTRDVNKPYIHYIDVKIMNNVSRVPTGLTYYKTELFL